MADVDPVATALHLDFIPQSVVAQLQSQDYQQRVDASSKIVGLVQGTLLSERDILSLLRFIEPFTCDQNYCITQNVSQVVSTMIPRLTSPASFLHEFIRIILRQFSDRRRTVCHQGESILCDLLIRCDHFEVLSQLFRSSTNATPSVYVEIFRCFQNLLKQGALDPESLLQFPFFFDAGLTSPHQNVKQAVMWCLNVIKETFPTLHARLMGMLSRDATAALGQSFSSPGTALTESRFESVFRTRGVNTAPRLGGSYRIPEGRTGYRPPTLAGGKQFPRPVSSFVDPPPAVLTLPENDHSIRLSQSLPRTAVVRPLADSVLSTVSFPDDDQPDPFFAIADESKRGEPPPPAPPSDPKPKKVSFGRMITFDAAFFGSEPETKGSSRQRPQARPPKHPAQSPLEDEDMPIHSSGFYNLGDDIDFEDSSPAPSVDRRRAPSLSFKRSPKPKPVKPRARAASGPVLAIPPPQKGPKVPALVEKLRTAEWSDQNDAITALMAEADQFPDQIQANLTGLVELLVQCGASLRSALARNALNCLLKWIGMGSIHFEDVADRAAMAFLGLVSSQRDKHFIAELAGQCFAALMMTIPAAKAVAICIHEHRTKHDAPRARVAAAMAELVPRMTDCSPFIRPLLVLLRDKNPDVRSAAKAAVAACRARFPNFAHMLEANVPSLEDRAVLATAL
jgi:hypothetical protein